MTCFGKNDNKVTDPNPVTTSGKIQISFNRFWRKTAIFLILDLFWRWWKFDPIGLNLTSDFEVGWPPVFKGTFMWIFQNRIKNMIDNLNRILIVISQGYGVSKSGNRCVKNFQAIKNTRPYLVKRLWRFVYKSVI